MRHWKMTLLTTSVMPAVVGLGVVVATADSTPARAAAAPSTQAGELLPVAKKRPAGVQLAACNPCNPCAAKSACNPCNPCAAASACSPCSPCAAKSPCNPCNPCAGANPCNPCAAANPCNPCAANPCNPCAAAGGGYVDECAVPRLQQAAACNPCNPCAAKSPCNPCNPCAAANPCNPCAAANPCNPCAAANPCNPCAAANPCNPCAGANPCGPCGAGAVADITPCEAAQVYACLSDKMANVYAKAGVKQVAGYQSWSNVAKHPYPSATHGNRYVNNYADGHGDYRYQQFEDAGEMPEGSVLAKDSFVVHANGGVKIGPLFVMEKMADGWNETTRDWRYTIIQPNGAVGGVTGGKGIDMTFCAECHNAVAPAQDSIFLLPEEARKSF